MKTKFKAYLQKYGLSAKESIRTLARSRWIITIFVILILAVAGIGISNDLYVYYMKKNFVNLFKMKTLIVDYIRIRMNKAVEMGVVDFNLFEGITFEDIKISNEADFSSSKMFFTSQRVDIIPTSIFAKQKTLEKIILHNSKLNLLEDQFSILNLVEYLEETGLPSIEFRNLSIEIRNEKEIIWKTKKPINILLQKKKDKFFIEITDAFLGISFFKSLEGVGSLDTKKREIDLSVNIRNYPLEIIPGSIKNISFFQPDSGYADGFVRMHQTTSDTSFDGNFDLFELDGKNTFFSGLTVESIPINCKLSYFKEIQEDGNSEIYFQRKINNPDFYYNENIHEDSTKSKKYIISALFQNLQNLSQYLDLENGSSLKGSIKVEIQALTNPKGKELLSADGLISIGNLDWKLGKPQLHFEIDEGTIAINQKGITGISSRGKLFGQKFEASLTGESKFEKSNAEGSLGFIMNSNLNANINIDTIYFINYQEIYQYFKTLILNDIKERQEKMLPQAYIMANKYYIAFFDKLKLDFNATSNSTGYNSDQAQIGKGNFLFKFNKGNFESELSIVDTSGDKKLISSLRGFVDKKSPYFDFRVKMSRFPVGIPFIDYCEHNLVPAQIQLEGNILSTGNNFSDIMVNKNFNLEYEFLDLSLVPNGQGGNENFLESFPTRISSLKGGWSGYGPESYFRNLEIYSSEITLKGSGNTTKNGTEVFNFWGIKDNKSYSLNLTTKKDTNKCTISKK